MVSVFHHHHHHLSLLLLLFWIKFFFITSSQFIWIGKIFFIFCFKYRIFLLLLMWVFCTISGQSLRSSIIIVLFLVWLGRCFVCNNVCICAALAHISYIIHHTHTHHSHTYEYRLSIKSFDQNRIDNHLHQWVFFSFEMNNLSIKCHLWTMNFFFFLRLPLTFFVLFSFSFVLLLFSMSSSSLDVFYPTPRFSLFNCFRSLASFDFFANKEQEKKIFHFQG